MGFGVFAYEWRRVCYDVHSERADVVVGGRKLMTLGVVGMSFACLRMTFACVRISFVVRFGG